MHVLKFASDQLEKLLARGKESFKNHNFDKVESGTVTVMATIRAGSMRYNSEKLNTYFSKEGINPIKFKTPSADSLVMQYISKLSN